MASVRIRKEIIDIEITLSKLEAEKLSDILEGLDDLDEDLSHLMVNLKNSLYS